MIYKDEPPKEDHLPLIYVPAPLHSVSCHSVGLQVTWRKCLGWLGQGGSCELLGRMMVPCSIPRASTVCRAQSCPDVSTLDNVSILPVLQVFRGRDGSCAQGCSLGERWPGALNTGCVTWLYIAIVISVGRVRDVSWRFPPDFGYLFWTGCIQARWLLEFREWPSGWQSSFVYVLLDCYVLWSVVKVGLQFTSLSFEDDPCLEVPRRTNDLSHHQT